MGYSKGGKSWCGRKKYRGGGEGGEHIPEERNYPGYPLETIKTSPNAEKEVGTCGVMPPLEKKKKSRVIRKGGKGRWIQRKMDEKRKKDKTEKMGGCFPN